MIAFQENQHWLCNTSSYGESTCSSMQVLRYKIPIYMKGTSHTKLYKIWEGMLGNRTIGSMIYSTIQ